MSEEDKKARKARKSALTREINSLRRHMAEGDRKTVEESLPGLKGKFTEFLNAHNRYHEEVKDDAQLDSSEEYFDTVENSYIDARLTLGKWLDETAKKEVKPDKKTVNETEALKKKDTRQMDFATWANLPKVEIPVFDGNPLQYQTFMCIFDEHVHKTPLEPSVKLTRLIHYTTGKVKEAIEICTLLGETGYDEAHALLKQRFGDDFIICNHIISNVKHGKKVKSQEDLQKFGDELSKARAILKSMGNLSEIDTQSNIMEIHLRLQPFLQHRWAKHVSDYKKANQAYPNFSHFVDFVVDASVEMNDPFYGPGAHVNRKQGDDKPKSQAAISFSTDASQRPESCIACGGQQHRLFYCETFTKQLRPAERLKLVRTHNLCENCLMDNHSTIQCRKNSVCSVPNCGQKHTKFVQVGQSNFVSGSELRSVNVNQACLTNVTNVVLPVVRVNVNDRYSTQALLDSGSNSSFCTERLARKLQLQCRPVKYSLKTLAAQDEDRNSMSVDLCLKSCNGDSMMQLCNVYVVPEIPADVPVVDLSAYPHLLEVRWISSSGRAMLKPFSPWKSEEALEVILLQ